MRYEIHMLIRRIVMLFVGKDCDSCKYYNGKFGSDCCFKCEHSYHASEFEKEK